MRKTFYCVCLDGIGSRQNSWNCTLTKSDIYLDEKYYCWFLEIIWKWIKEKPEPFISVCAHHHHYYKLRSVFSMPRQTMTQQLACAWCGDYLGGAGLHVTDTECVHYVLGERAEMSAWSPQPPRVELCQDQCTHLISYRDSVLWHQLYWKKKNHMTEQKENNNSWKDNHFGSKSNFLWLKSAISTYDAPMMCRQKTCSTT